MGFLLDLLWVMMFFCFARSTGLVPLMAFIFGALHSVLPTQDYFLHTVIGVYLCLSITMFKGITFWSSLLMSTLMLHQIVMLYDIWMYPTTETILDVTYFYIYNSLIALLLISDKDLSCVSLHNRLDDITVGFSNVLYSARTLFQKENSSQQ